VKIRTVSLRRRLRHLWPKELSAQLSAGAIMVLAGVALIMVGLAIGK
jgi:hypothetical protein